jgi:hypothetical protein
MWVRIGGQRMRKKKRKRKKRIGIRLFLGFFEATGFFFGPDWMGCGRAGGVGSLAARGKLSFFQYRPCTVWYRSGGARIKK